MRDPGEQQEVEALKEEWWLAYCYYEAACENAARMAPSDDDFEIAVESRKLLNQVATGHAIRAFNFLRKADVLEQQLRGRGVTVFAPEMVGIL